jgi:hypothetical protein
LLDPPLVRSLFQALDRDAIRAGNADVRVRRPLQVPSRRCRGPGMPLRYTIPEVGMSK